MRTTIKLLALLPLFHPATLLATDYYVAPGGNDENDGHSPASAWRSVERVNTMAFRFQPGDRILFERGGTYRGELIGGIAGTADAPITFGAYGQGSAPIIKGSATVGNWVQHSGNVWRAPLSARPVQVYVDGERATLARYPDSGWLRATSGRGGVLASPDIPGPDGRWNGARVILRRTSSSIDTLIVSEHSNGTLRFTENFPDMGDYDWGFFIQRKAEILDAPGEWYHDPEAGMLYLYFPAGSVPNTSMVEATIHDAGLHVHWRRKHIAVSDLHFMHQRVAGVRVDEAIDIRVTNCRFEHSFHGIRSVGTDCIYTNNIFRNTYATAALLIDANVLFENNDLQDIALLPGEGEHAWGYFGVRAIGQGHTIRHNRFDRIGYTALEVAGSGLVERNVMRRMLATLNDGGGIAFDHVDGLTIQDNIIGDPICSLEGASTMEPHPHRMGVGIYFGNTNIRNATVQRNTVSGCPGSGINVDHTMVSEGLRIRNNTLFGNNIQLAVSDYSNYNGPGATAPYHRPNYNDLYEGNILYSTAPDQLCMRQYHCYAAAPVDFGDYRGNRYFSPYNEMSILVFNTFDGGPRYYSFERWKAERESETGSKRSPLRLSPWRTTEVLSDELVENGNFDQHVNGWGGWPSNATVTHVTNRLDGGALRAHLPNNSVYPEFSLRSPQRFQVRADAWYRMRLSIVGDTPGEVLAGLKAASQLHTPYALYEMRLPFDSERRDIEFHFRSNIDDLAEVMITNHWRDPLYYLDNVSLEQVHVEPVNPEETQRLLVNDGRSTITLPIEGCWVDVDDNPYRDHVALEPFSSKVLIRAEDEVCRTIGIHTPVRKPELGLYPNPVERGGSVELERPTDLAIEVIDLQGRIVHSSKAVPGTVRFAVPQHVPAGSYLVRSGQATTRLVVR